MPRASRHLRLENVTKTFGSLVANDRVSLRVRRGSVHAILGENGAGKTTLMNILYGLYQPDAGGIYINEQLVQIQSPRDALGHGIGMVHQHLMLVGPFTVTENVILGMKNQRLLLARTEHARKIAETSRSFGFDVEPDEVVERLPIGMQQRVEILRLLYNNADILILDEPTSVLTPGETGPFFELLQRLAKGGKTIILITHKLDEVMQASSYVTVMRDGRAVTELETRRTSKDELARLMVGRTVIFDIDRPPHQPGDVVLEAENVHARNDRGLPALNGLSFQVRAGEILGVAGVDGNGQRELAEVITGLRPLTGGSIRLNGNDISNDSVYERIHRDHMGYVPEDRQRTGLVLDHSASMNSILRSYDRAPFARHGLFDFKAIREHARRLVELFTIRLRDVDQEVRYMSGGNQQKLILAREFEGHPRVLIVAQATKGLDVGATEFVQNAILRQRQEGRAILYISTELEHLLAVADRIAVIFRGRFTGVMNAEEATTEQLGMLMAGGEA